ncbi:hypothetical protein T439DRAFT_245713 [Meredithblackwellia eburnea MCA 4105]
MLRVRFSSFSFLHSAALVAGSQEGCLKHLITARSDQHIPVYLVSGSEITSKTNARTLSGHQARQRPTTRRVQHERGRVVALQRLQSNLVCSQGAFEFLVLHVGATSNGKPRVGVADHWSSDEEQHVQFSFKSEKWWLKRRRDVCA